MTPDEDERMERAERIRKLRERGNGDADPADHNGDGAEGGSSENTDGEGGMVSESTTGATGVELPGTDELEAALADEGGADGAPTPESETTPDPEPNEGVEGDAGPALAGATRHGAATAARARVLEFALGDELYCIDIADVEEIVERETVTRVPNTPEYVQGVVDLRGQITTILDAKRLLDIERDGPESLVVVFAPDAFEDQGAVGWIVDEVRQVRPITDEQVREAPMDDDHVEGIVDAAESDDLLVWVRPGETIDAAVADSEE